MITAETLIRYERKSYRDVKLIALYKGVLRPRMIEEKMLLLLRQGVISKWFSGIGQEGSSVGAAMAMDSDEYLLPMHRNLGVFTSRGVPLNRLFSQFQGKEDGFTKGRDRSFHFGSQEFNIIGMISHLGSQLGVADGIALANILKKNNKASLVFSGDGGASEGDFHEALNVAAVWDLPVIFAIENNGYGLSTPSHEQYRCKQFIDKGIGYGMEAIQIDGNNVLEVYDTVKRLTASIRKNPRPVLLELVTFRMRGHEEASGTKYVPDELLENWGKKDPLMNFEFFLLEEGVLSGEMVKEYRDEIKKEIEAALALSNAASSPAVDTELELKDVYAPFVLKEQSPSLKKESKRYIDAISDGLHLAMHKHQNLVLMGQDIADYGGVFKITEGFVKEFDKSRVRNTPLCEAAILGASLGLSIAGMKSMVEMQFADFVTEGFNQIVNNLAKSHYRWGQNADVVIRMPTGAGMGAGPFHSQSTEAWFIHTPGLKVVYPAFPSDAKGLLLTAFEDVNPVMFFEHKALYRTISEDVSEGYYTIPFGKANLIKEGDDITIITYGLGVHWSVEILERNPEIKADLLDLRTLLPYDKEAVLASVKKTGKAIVLHEDTLLGGFGAELAAVISEECFEYLDAPVIRSASLDSPIPMNPDLEANFLPKARFEQQLLDLLKY